jgi:hypothetical protein
LVEEVPFGSPENGRIFRAEVREDEAEQEDPETADGQENGTQA